MTEKIDWSISAIRMISMVFIITCHFMQYLDFELAWWFNVGVQIFLCISGFLYGKKIINTLTFLKNGFKKILVSFYVVFIPFATILVLIDKIKIDDILFNAILIKNIPGGEHFWFIPTILCCYAITPFFSLYFDKKSKINIVIRYLLAILCIYYVFYFHIPNFTSSWIVCYITGFFLSKVSNTVIYKTSAMCFIILALLTNTVQILSDYVTNTKFVMYGFFCDCAHVLLGVSIFIILKFLLKSIKKSKILQFSDKYSYEIYLVHQFFILGPLTLMNITPYTSLNIFIIIILILICGVLAKIISNNVHKLIDYCLLKFCL